MTPRRQINLVISIINTLNMFSDYNLLVYYNDTGKGGVHRVYSMNENISTEKDIMLFMYQTIKKKMKDEKIIWCEIKNDFK